MATCAGTIAAVISTCALLACRSNPARQGGGPAGTLAPMFDTALTRLLNLDVPIVQAPIAGLTGPELVAAVSNAGALGMLSVTWRKPEEIRPH